jgi:hypothetical protein
MVAIVRKARQNLYFVSHIAILEGREQGRGRCHCRRDVVEAWESNPPYCPVLFSKATAQLVTPDQNSDQHCNIMEQGKPVENTQGQIWLYWAPTTALSPNIFPKPYQSSAEIHGVRFRRQSITFCHRGRSYDDSRHPMVLPCVL